MIQNSKHLDSPAKVPASSLKKPVFSWQAICKKAGSWASEHNGIVSVLTGTGIAAAILAILAFTVFSGLGSTADFIYNQF